MSHPEQQYLDLLWRLRYGTDVAIRGDRTGTGTRGIFGAQMRFDLQQGFPLLTTKKVFWKSVVAELLWMLRGETNIIPLIRGGVSIWTDWPLKDFNKRSGQNLTVKQFEAALVDGHIGDAWGELGPVYGAQWRRFPEREGCGGHIDQIALAQELIRKDPNSRRNVVTAWNPAWNDDMALHPCHCLFQFFVADGKLSCQLYQRSADIFLGVPFNIASYALLTHLMAAVCDLEVGDFVHTFGDLHLYNNHLDAATEQLERVPLPFPSLHLHSGADTVKNVWDMEAEYISLSNYTSHPAIKAEVSV